MSRAVALVLLLLGSILQRPPFLVQRPGPDAVVLARPPQPAGTLGSGLVAYWYLNETSGDREAAVGGYTLADNNTVGYGTGKNGNAADFTAASGEWLEYSSASWLASISATSADFTIAVWYYLPSGDASYRTIAAQYQGTKGFVYWWTGSAFQFCSAANCGLTSSGYSTNAWNLHVFGRNLTPRPFYSINGATPTILGANGAGADATHPFSLGARLSANGTPHVSPSYNDSLIDEVMVWDRGLTSAEIAELFNAGAGKFYPF